MERRTVFAFLLGLFVASACTAAQMRQDVTLTADGTEVVVAAGAAPAVRFAAAEMTNFLSRAFGTRIPIAEKPTSGKTAVFLRTADATGCF